jgi:hypothetical protein
VVSTTSPLSYSRAIEIKFPLIYRTCNTSVRIILLIYLLTLIGILTCPRLILGSVNPFTAIIDCSTLNVVYLINAVRSSVI